MKGEHCLGATRASSDGLTGSTRDTRLGRSPPRGPWLPGDSLPRPRETAVTDPVTCPRGSHTRTSSGLDPSGHILLCRK